MHRNDLCWPCAPHNFQIVINILPHSSLYHRRWRRRLLCHANQKLVRWSASDGAKCCPCAASRHCAPPERSVVRVRPVVITHPILSKPRFKCVCPRLEFVNRMGKILLYNRLHLVLNIHHLLERSSNIVRDTTTVVLRHSNRYKYYFYSLLVCLVDVNLL
jgi:hypothetical protein